MITRNEDGTFSADARATLEEVSAAIGIALTDSELADDIDTLGGLLVTLIGRVPVRGEIIVSSGGLEYEVLDADPRRIKPLTGMHNCNESWLVWPPRRPTHRQRWAK